MQMSYLNLYQTHLQMTYLKSLWKKKIKDFADEFIFLYRSILKNQRIRQ